MNHNLTNMKKFSLLAIFLTPALGFAQAVAEEAPVIVPEPSLGLTTSELVVVASLIFAILLLVVAITLYNSLKVLYNERLNPTPYQKYVETPWSENEEQTNNLDKPSLWTKLLGLKPLSEEKDLEIPHEYDGIKELNNPIPVWFNVLFYGSLIFAAGYMYYYHIGNHGERQDDEYATEMAKADFDKQKFLAKSGSSVDENSVKVDPSEVAVGKGVYDANCVACHGDKGEGIVGPNLADEFWLHGGSVKDIFKVVKYGVVEKGMVAWEKNMSAGDMSAVTNYIISLKGTNPPNAKEPQGEKYVPEAEEVAL